MNSKIRRQIARLLTRTLLPQPYALYRDPCTSDRSRRGRPQGRYPSLQHAMRASGHPEPADWQADTACSPDEAFASGRHHWSIVAAGAARETELLKASAALDAA